MCLVRYGLVILLLSVSFVQAIAQTSGCANQLEGPCAKQEISLRMNDLQAGLRPLPLPLLAETLERYLASCKPLLSAADFARTEKIVAEYGHLLL